MPHFEALGFADAATIAFLVFLEGILSIDNVLVLALLASSLPKAQQKKALSYGLFGAIVFRVIAVSFALFLLHATWLKILGSAYLFFLCLNYWRKRNHPKENREHKKRGFWTTVLVIELTDIAFAVDSILTAVALSKKLLVVILGGVIGLLLMRYAASIFIRLLERFPAFESTAYLLVFFIAGKLGCEALQVLDFQAPLVASAFWLTMLMAFLSGFREKKKI